MIRFSREETDSFSKIGKDYIERRNKIYEAIQSHSIIPSSDGIFIAFDILKLNDNEKEILHYNLWNKEFIDLVMFYISCQEKFWTLFISAIGNITSEETQVTLSFTETSSFIDMIRGFLSGEIKQNHADIYALGTTVQIYIAWIISNILHFSAAKASERLSVYSLPPSTLTKILNTDFYQVIPIMLMQAEKTSNFDLLGLTVTCFRALSPIFYWKENQLKYPEEYQRYLRIIQTSDLQVFKVLLLELKYGMEGNPVPNTKFFPLASDRALSVQFLAGIPEAQEPLVKSGVIPLLTQSLSIITTDSDKETIFLWTRAVKALHSLTKSKRFHHLLLEEDTIELLVMIASGRVGAGDQYKMIGGDEEFSDNEDLPGELKQAWEFSAQLAARRDHLYVSLPIRILAADIIIALGMKWEVQRLLWITQKKPQNSNCYLARLPAELIRPIMKWVIILGGIYEEDKYLMKEIKSLLRADS